jgi:hypothetical protein
MNAKLLQNEIYEQFTDGVAEQAIIEGLKKRKQEIRKLLGNPSHKDLAKQISGVVSTVKKNIDDAKQLGTGFECAVELEYLTTDLVGRLMVELSETSVRQVPDAKKLEQCYRGLAQTSGASTSKGAIETAITFLEGQGVDCTGYTLKLGELFGAEEKPADAEEAEAQP